MDAGGEERAEEHELEPVAVRAWRATEVEDPAEETSQILGRLSANPFGADSTANPYATEAPLLFRE